MLKFNLRIISYALIATIGSIYPLDFKEPFITLYPDYDLNDRLHGLELTEDGNIILFSEHKSVNLTTLQGENRGQSLCSFDNVDPVFSLRANYQENKLATGSKKGVVQIFDIETQGFDCILSDGSNVSYVNEICWDESGNLVLATPASGLEQLTIWDIRSNERIFRHKDNEFVNTAALSPSGKHIVMGYRNRISDSNVLMEIWDIVAGRFLCESKISKKGVDTKRVMYSTDGRSLLNLTSHDVTMWDTDNGIPIKGVLTPEEKFFLTDACLNKKHPWTIVAGTRGTVSNVSSAIAIIDNKKEEVVGQLKGGSGFTYVASCGETVAAFDRNDGKIRVFKIDNRAE